MSANDAPTVEAPEHAIGFGDLDSIPTDQLATATTYLYRIAEDGRKLPPGSGREMYLAKFVGRLVDLDEVRERWGGGSFMVMVVQRGGMMLKRAVVNIDGPPRLAPSEPAVPEVATSSEADRVAAAVSLALAPALEQLASVVRVVAESKQTPPPAPAVDPLALVREVMSVVRESAPAASGATASEMMKVFREGMTLGREAESPTKSVGDAIAEVAPKALEALSNIGQAMASRPPMRRAAAPPRAGGGKPVASAPSNAVVVEGAPAVDQGNAVVARVRWLVDHLDMMRESGADAGKVADVVEDLLTEFEIKKLTGYVAVHDGQVGVNTSALLAELGQVVPAPAGLVTEDGQRWLAEFLVRLAEPAESDDAASEAPTS